MDQGIKAIWYDLPNDGRDAYFDWLNGTYLPQVLHLPGRLWAAHYEITGGGKEMDTIGNILARADYQIRVRHVYWPGNVVESVCLFPIHVVEHLFAVAGHGDMRPNAGFCTRTGLRAMKCGCVD